MNTLKDDLKIHNVEEYKPLKFFALSLVTCGAYGIVKVVNHNWYNNYKLYMAIKMIKKDNVQLAYKYLDMLKFNRNKKTSKDAMQMQTYTDLIGVIENKINVGPQKFESPIKNNEQVLNLEKPKLKNKMSNRRKVVIGIIAVAIVAAIGSNKQDNNKIVAQQQQEQPQQQVEQVQPPKEVKQEQPKEQPKEEQPKQEEKAAAVVNTAPAGDIVADRNSHIYHLPTQKHYNIKAANEVHFKTEQEAINAGYRAAKR